MNKALDGTNHDTSPLQATVFEHGEHSIHMVLPSAEDHIAKQILGSGAFYEAELLQSLGRELSADDLVLDVGANIGNHTVYFGKVCDCRVVSFEPNPGAFALLRENVRLNALEDRVTLHQLAVGSKAGRAAIVSALPNNLGATRLGVAEKGAFELVRLDDLSYEGKIALIKIDVEGMEGAVLHGAAAIIRKHRPMIVCEAQTPAEFDELWRMLDGLCYAAVGCFNATDTYLFMPAQAGREQQRLARHEAAELVRTQVKLRAATSQLQKLKQVVDKQAFLHRQLSSRVGGDEEQGAAGLSGDVRLLSERTNELARIVDSVSFAVEQTRELQSRIDRLDGHLAAFSSQLGDARQMESRLDRLDGQVTAFARLMGDAQRLEARLEHLDAELRQVDARMGERDEVVAGRVNALEAATAQLQASSDELRGSHFEHRAEYGTQVQTLRSAIGEIGLRIDHVLVQQGKERTENQAQLKRLDGRISEQVRLGKETAAAINARWARVDQLERELALLRSRHDALLQGRIFSMLRRMKSVVRVLAWPLLKMRRPIAPAEGVQPSLSAPAATAAAPVGAPKAVVAAPVAGEARAPVVAAKANPAARVGPALMQEASTAAPVAAAVAAEEPAEVAPVLTDVPYMRRPLKALRRDFLNLPIPENALVSVVMTTYNSAKYLGKAIDSILAQTHTNLELIVVDDCSTDGTRDMVEAIATTDKRVKLLSFGENRGTYWCKNFGITQASGAAITFMDSDDVSEPTRIAMQLEQLRAPGTAVSTCLHERRDSEGNLIAVNGRTRRIAYISQMMRREVFDTIGYFDCVRTSADDEMLRRIKRVFGESAHQCVQEVLYKALVHGESLTQDPANRGVSAAPGGLSAPRKAYSEAVDAWHEALRRRGAYPFVPFPVVRRPFPVHEKLSVIQGGTEPREHISACLASFPPRRSALRAAVGSLIDQVDRIYVYLNQYEEIPDFLKHPRITVKLGGEDLRDNGKFYFTPELPEGYCFTVDDDIIYPSDYVQGLIRRIELYGRKALVGVHGTIFAKPLVTYFRDRTLMHFKYPLDRDRIVNQLGTGTLAFHTSLWRPAHTDFSSTGMVDAWIAVEAAKRNIPLIAVQRKRNWLRPMEEFAGAPPSLFEEYKERDAAQTSLVQTIPNWVEEPGQALATVIARKTAAGGQAFANAVADMGGHAAAGEAPVVAATAGEGLTLLQSGAEPASRPIIRACVRHDSAAGPERLEALVTEMSFQVDELYVVLAPGERVPAFLAGRRGVHVVSSQFRDARAQFEAVEGFKGYYIPLDSSIVYPRHYVQRLVDSIDRHGRKAVVGWHGQPGSTPVEETVPGDRQVRSLSVSLCAFHTDTIRIGRADISADDDVEATIARLGRVQGAPFVEIDDAPSGTKALLQAEYLAVRGAIAPKSEQQDVWLPVLQPAYRRPLFRLAVVGRTDRDRWKKGGILKSTHLTAEMLHPYGVDVALVDLETGDPKGLDGKPADIVMIYPGDPERPDFVNVIELVDHHASFGRAVLVNLSLNGRASRKKFICEQMATWRAQYGARVKMMVFSDRVFDDPELQPVLDSIVAVPKTLQIEPVRHMDFHSTSGIFLGDYGKLCDESLLAWPAEEAIKVLREAVPNAPLFAVQQYRPKVKKDLGIEIVPFLTDDYSEVLGASRLMVSLVKFATFEMVPIEVAALGVPLLHAKMENSLSDYMGLGAVEVTSLDRLGTFASLLYSDPLCWSGMSRAGHSITNGLNHRNLSAQMYLRLLQFLRESGAAGTA